MGCVGGLLPTGLFYLKKNEGNWFENISGKVADRLSGRAKEYTLSRMKAMNEAILNLEPDLIILDSFISFNYWLIHHPVKEETPIVLVQTTFATNRKDHIPPLNTTLFPNGNFLNRLRIRLAWNQVFIKRHFSNAFSILPTWWQTTMDLSKFNRHDLKSTVNWKGTFKPSVNGCIELVLAPKSFDWTVENNPIHQIYVGCQGNFRKEENMEDDRIWSQVLLKMQKEHDKVWVYCSLGTANLIHNRLSSRLLQQITDAFASKQDWRLILTTGMVDQHSLKRVPPNVYIFRNAPQLSLLKRCKIMINHGGTNSVFEGIHVGIPMLVYPLGWDQPGIAARVVYHGLGIMGNIKRETAKGIQDKLTILIANSQISEKCQQWQRRILIDNKTDEVADFLSKIISTKHKTSS